MAVKKNNTKKEKKIRLKLLKKVVMTNKDQEKNKKRKVEFQLKVEEEEVTEVAEVAIEEEVANSTRKLIPMKKDSQLSRIRKNITNTQEVKEEAEVVTEVATEAAKEEEEKAASEEAEAEEKVASEVEEAEVKVKDHGQREITKERRNTEEEEKLELKAWNNQLKKRLNELSFALIPARRGGLLE